MADKMSKEQDSEAEKLRKVFYAKYNVTDLADKGVYDARDVDRVASNDLYVRQFIRKTETIQDAADRLNEALKWRKEIEINDCTEDSFDRQVWEKGAVYFHNHDKDNRKILMIRVKEHKKDAQTLPIIKKFFAYHLEITYHENPKEEIVVLFDMADAGISNLDMDLIKFVITSFKIYYPVLLGYMLIYEMPWLFNAAWKIIKTWLSAEAVKKIKFVSKSDVQEYINKDQLWEHMGGTDKFQYQYIPPEARDENDTSRKKQLRVTFAEQDRFRSINCSEIDVNNSAQNNNAQDQNSPHRAAVRGSYGRDRDENVFIGRLLTIRPAEELEFNPDDTGRETYDVISLKNTLPYSIAYKVKTTSPEKYRVRPSSGVVKPGSSVEVHVYLQHGSHNISKDKFLVMAMEMRDESTDRLPEMWKTISRDNIMEHRLRCIFGSSKNGSISSQDSFTSSVPDQINKLSAKVDDLIDSNRRLEKTVKILMILQILFLLVFLLMGVSYYMSGGVQQTEGSNSTASGYCSGSLFT